MSHICKVEVSHSAPMRTGRECEHGMDFDERARAASGRGIEPGVARSDGGDDCGDSVSSTQEYFLKWDRKYLTPLFCRAEAIPAERKYCIDGHHEDVGAISVSDEDCFSLIRSSRWTGDGPLEDRAVGIHKKKGALQALDAERDRAPANAQVESTVL